MSDAIDCIIRVSSENKEFEDTCGSLVIEEKALYVHFGKIDIAIPMKQILECIMEDVA